MKAITQTRQGSLRYGKMAGKGQITNSVYFYIAAKHNNRTYIRKQARQYDILVNGVQPILVVLNKKKANHQGLQMIP